MYENTLQVASIFHFCNFFFNKKKIENLETLFVLFFYLTEKNLFGVSKVLSFFDFSLL